MIVRLANSEEVDLGIIANGLVYNYNAKPFLSNKSHQTKISEDCFEISLSVHTFGHAARTYYYEMHENFKNWVMDVAVVVEGREDNAQLLSKSWLAVALYAQTQTNTNSRYEA